MLARGLWEAHGGLCQRCGLPIDPSLSGLLPGGLTIGHRLAIAHGGTNDRANLGPEHRRCNLSGGTDGPRPTAVIVEPIP